MKKGLTELVFVLDMSGSMWDLTQDTIGGYNSLLEQNKKAGGECLVSTVFFNDEAKVIHDRVPIEKVPAITDSDYSPNGSTALVDAFAGAIHHIGNVHKYAREEDVPEKTLFIVMTDGYENASRKYRSSQLKHMVEHERKKYGWEFLFVGANIDAFATASAYGINPGMISNYIADKKGTKLAHSAIGGASVKFRQNSAQEAKILIEEEMAVINLDYENRK